MIKQMDEITEVIFRVFNNGDVIALFPGIPGTSNPYTCMSFMHVGQHSAADPRIVDTTRLATPKEYADLKRELESRGYRLKVRQRISQRYLAERQKHLAA